MIKICEFCGRELDKGRKYCTRICRKMDYSRRRLMAKTHKSSSTKKFESLCWKCNKCYGDCSWSDLSFTPIEGWKAIKSIGVDDSGHTYDSYTVIGCPEFERDRRFK